MYSSATVNESYYLALFFLRYILADRLIVGANPVVILSNILGNLEYKRAVPCKGSTLKTMLRDVDIMEVRVFGLPFDSS